MTQAELVQNLVRSGFLKTPEIIEAFKRADRAEFIKETNLNEAYEDYPLPIGKGATISQPSTVAFMLELLSPKKGDKVLDVGSGSGWTTALLAHIVGGSEQVHAGDAVQVYGVDIEPELVEFGRENLQSHGLDNAAIEHSGEIMGLPDHAPYDRILVSAAAKEIPQELIDQLKVNGRMVIPVQSSVWRVDKVSEKKIRKKEFFGFSFVPLRQDNNT